MEVTCERCKNSMVFEQPYAYHAGFGNQGFLYNDAGVLTLVWSSFDPAYQDVVGKHHPWALTSDLQQLLESRLSPAPTGGRWRFCNPARCQYCGSEISGPMLKNIYYLLYKDSLDVDSPESGRGLAPLISPRAAAESG